MGVDWGGGGIGGVEVMAVYSGGVVEQDCAEIESFQFKGIKRMAKEEKRKKGGKGKK